MVRTVHRSVLFNNMSKYLIKAYDDRLQLYAMLAASVKLCQELVLS